MNSFAHYLSASFDLPSSRIFSIAPITIKNTGAQVLESAVD